MPRFSVVVPTRDRPDLLAFCLESLAGQTFGDVEVVVSDNPTRTSSRAVFDRWAKPGWRYLRAERPLPMHENFERGCAEATGEYVAVVTDKMVFQPSAFEVVDRTLATEPSADIVTWRNEAYFPVDEARDVGKGAFTPRGPIVAPVVYDAAAELAQRFSNAVRRGKDRVHYVRGKIVFGVYSRSLLERIRDQAGRVFFPITPDYTSMVLGSVLSRRAIDVGRPLIVSCSSQRGNGYLFSVNPSHARRFIEATDPRLVSSLPIPGLYASHHNVVAYDLVSSAARCPPNTTPELDVPNLLRRAREDLDAVMWPDPAERARQYAILESFEARLGIVREIREPRKPAVPAQSRRPRAFPRLRSLRRFPLRSRTRQMPSPPYYSSPVDGPVLTSLTNYIPEDCLQIGVFS